MGMSNRQILGRRGPVSALRSLLAAESAGGIVLMAIAAIAIIVANSPYSGEYYEQRDAYIGPLSVLHWINDGLMAVFFLLVGLEIKRELIDGELRTWDRRRLPGIAALAGMAVPALIYTAVNADDPVAMRGWAIPAATDIAFALGVLALLGRAVPVSLKVFLTAVAIIDDLGAVIIIAIFYTADLNLQMLGAALGGIGVLAVFNLMNLRALWFYLLPAPLIWWAMYQSGVHATIAGVLIAMTVPLRQTMGHPDAQDSPLHRLEHMLVPLAAFVVVPIFGFANAGVSFAGMTPETLLSGIPLGIAAGLFLGKQLGIFAAIWIAVKTGFADLPANASWRQTYGVCLLCGIGFTMSLFIGELAFTTNGDLESQVKLGVIVGSLLSAVAGAMLLLSAKPQRQAETD